jgi:hypothetical protein
VNIELFALVEYGAGQKATRGKFCDGLSSTPTKPSGIIPSFFAAFRSLIRARSRSASFSKLTRLNRASALLAAWKLKSQALEIRRSRSLLAGSTRALMTAAFTSATMISPTSSLTVSKIPSFSMLSHWRRLSSLGVR